MSIVPFESCNAANHNNYWRETEAVNILSTRLVSQMMSYNNVALWRCIYEKQWSLLHQEEQLVSQILDWRETSQFCFENGEE